MPKVDKGNKIGSGSSVIPAAPLNMRYPPGCKEITEDLSTDDLVRRMKDIAMAFQQMSQEDDNSLYISLAKYLATDYFLDHPSRDVRLLVACAVADVFRVYAPNAPYQEPDLIKRIFTFFIQQLKGLQDPKDAIFKRYFYLLENLAWVKSFNICIELEDSQTIFCQLFSLIFKIVNDNHSEKVKNFMLDMMTPLIQEADTVSQKLIEIILWQIIEPRKSQHKQACWLATQIIRKTSKTIEPYLVSYFNSALTHGVHANAGELSDDEDGESLKEKKSQTTQATVSQLCELIYELNLICPAIMEGILPQLEFKIRSNEEKERCEFTKLLARLFSDKNSNLAEQYSELWKSFLGRFRDISVTVRMRCVQYSMHFLINHPELREDITEQLKQRQHDPDENVRYEVVMAIISAAKKGIENINEDLLSFVKERTLDKKFKIRREALFGMAQLYKLNNVSDVNIDDPTAPNAAALKMLNWIKNKCLHNYYQTQLDDRLLVERILHTCLIPFSLPLNQRMKTLYTFYCSIDAHAARAFNELLRQQLAVRKQVKEVLDILKEEKTDERDLILRQKIQATAKNLPEPVKADEYLQKLCKNLDANAGLRQHMEIIVTATSYFSIGEDGSFVPPPNCAQIEASVKEVLKSLGFPVQTNSFYIIVKQLMERIAPVLIDHQGLLQLFQYVSDSLIGDGEMDAQLGIENSARRGLQLIHSLSSVFPAIFYGREIFTQYLLPFLWESADHPEVAEVVLQILTNVGASVGAIKSASSTSTSAKLKSIPWWAQDEDIIQRIIDKFILKASSTKQSKYAIQCLDAIIQEENEKMNIFGEMIDKIKTTGLSLESQYFRNHLVTIGMIATCGGCVFFPAVLKSIVNKCIVQNLLLKDQRLIEEIQTQEEQEKARDQSDPAITYDLCSEEVKCKVEGIKLMVRWLFGLKQNSLTCTVNPTEAVSTYQKFAQNTLKLLKTLIANQGDLNENGLAGTTVEKAHLRLAAAAAMLKIAANDAVTSVAGPNGEPTVFSTSMSATSSIVNPTEWHILSTVLIDGEEFVREKFAQKLHKGLVSLALGLEFLAILCLGGTFENNSQMRTKLRQYLMLNLAKRRDLVKSKAQCNLKAIMPDCVMPYVIHLLAHSPFYTQFDDVQQLEIVKECLWFIMEPLVLKNEHYSFSFYKRTFENIKTCIDRVSASAPESIESNGGTNGSTPTISTMTNYKIYCACDLALGLVMSKTQNFLLKDFPVQPSLPGKYYMVSPSAVDNNLKCYLPPEMMFAPPKRCGLETEILGKITKTFSQQKAKSSRSSSVSSNNSNSAPIVVFTGDAVVDDNMIIEQEAPIEATVVQVQKTSTPVVIRSRKQELPTVQADTSGEEHAIAEQPPAKKARQEKEAEPVVPPPAPTRASRRGKSTPELVTETPASGEPATEQEVDTSKTTTKRPTRGGRGATAKVPEETAGGDVVEEQTSSRRSSRAVKKADAKPVAEEVETARPTRSTRSRTSKAK